MTSLYSSDTIKTHIIDPVFNQSNQRSIFRLPNDTHILSNMRLGNIGATTTNATQTGTYIKNIGALGVIENIHLMDKNNTVLDQLLNVPQFMAFKTFNRSNNKQKDNEPELRQTAMGMTFGGQTLVDGNGQEVQAVGSRKIQRYGLNTANRYITQYDSTSSRAWVSVSDLLPFLKSMLVLDTSILRDLQLVIEYTTELGNYANDETLGTYGTNQPFLIVDEHQGQPIPFENTEYVSIEHDRINFNSVLPTPAQAQLNQQSVNRLNGFSNKSVSRMLLIKTPTLKTTFQSSVGNNNFYGALGSKAFFKEVCQVRLNGMSVFPSNGISSDNERLAYLNDSWGQCSSYPFSNGQAFKALQASDNRNKRIDTGNPVISELDYIGFNVNQNISDLQIDFQRTGVYVNDTGLVDITNTASVNQAFIMNVYAEVNKQIVSDNNGSFIIQYL
tara:strand:- start:3527 stop:4858 length:1332 start_codon:yes stop_codon:yes gene_type:complete